MQLVYNSIGFFLSQVMRYRCKVSTQNIARSFPLATYQEVSHYHRGFYRNLGRVFYESLFVKKKILSLTEDAVALLNTIKLENRNIILILGHYGNWELMKQLPLSTDIRIQALYKPLANKFWNCMMKSIRERHGLRLIPAQQALRTLLKEKNSCNLTVFVADQFPGKNKGTKVEFLNQQTYLYTGAEQIAQKLNAYVIYGEITPLDYQRWHLSIETICEEASLTKKGEISRSFAQKLEQSIQENPSLWLWSHKRWK